MKLNAARGNMCFLLILVATALGCTKGNPPGTGPTPKNASNLKLSIQKSCNDSYTAYIQAYDENSADIWPDATTSWSVTNGKTVTTTISCSSGNKICLGAANNADNTLGYWGVGAGNRFTCTNCCYTCDDTDVPTFNLTCN